jgi:hypothetical protein
MGAFVGILGLAGYILPIPSLIWGWVKWWNTNPRFSPDRWRRTAVFASLMLSSFVGLFVLFVMTRANGLPEGPAKYSFAMASGRSGFAVSIFALLLSLLGNGPARLPASLASFGLAALWIVASLMY